MSASVHGRVAIKKKTPGNLGRAALAKRSWIGSLRWFEPRLSPKVVCASIIHLRPTARSIPLLYWPPRAPSSPQRATARRWLALHRQRPAKDTAAPASATRKDDPTNSTKPIFLLRREYTDQALSFEQASSLAF